MICIYVCLCAQVITWLTIYPPSPHLEQNPLQQKIHVVSSVKGWSQKLAKNIFEEVSFWWALSNLQMFYDVLCHKDQPKNHWKNSHLFLLITSHKIMFAVKPLGNHVKPIFLGAFTRHCPTRINPAQVFFASNPTSFRILRYCTHWLPWHSLKSAWHPKKKVLWKMGFPHFSMATMWVPTNVNLCKSAGCTLAGSSHESWQG